MYAMDESNKTVEITVICKAIRQPFEIDKKILRENEDKCLKFGLEWIKPNQKLIEIQPEYYDASGKINCLVNNPKKLIQALPQSEKIEKGMIPQFPKYIPYDAVCTVNGCETIWHFYGTPIKITFEKGLKPTDWHPGKESIPLYLFAKEFMMNPIMLFYEGCVIAAVTYYILQ
jgi:hypothetical protein